MIRYVSLLALLFALAVPFDARSQISSPAPASTPQRETINIERHGGAIRLPSGKVLIRSHKNYSMPLLGKRYLLFLKYNDSTEDYHLLTAYQLEGSHVYRLDDLDYAHKDRHPDVLVHPLHEQGDTEDKFLGRVKAAKPPTTKGGN